MSVCQYYLRGNCRYGNRCRLPHVGSSEPREYYPNNPPFRPRPPINPDYIYRAPSSNHRVDNRVATAKENSKFAAIFKWTKENFADEEKALDVLGELQREAKVWQKTEHLWRFTSRSLFPGGQPLPDWSDQSFEEIKWTYRWMTDQNQGHVYKKAYSKYYETIVRHLNELATLKLDRLILLKDYIQQYVASNYKPVKTLATNVDMRDVDEVITTRSSNQAESTNYAPDDQLLEDERAAFQSDTFEFGQIPIHAPPRQLC